VTSAPILRRTPPHCEQVHAPGCTISSRGKCSGNARRAGLLLCSRADSMASAITGTAGRSRLSSLAKDRPLLLARPGSTRARDHDVRRARPRSRHSADTLPISTIPILLNPSRRKAPVSERLHADDGHVRRRNGSLRQHWSRVSWPQRLRAKLGYMRASYSGGGKSCAGGRRRPSYSTRWRFRLCPRQQLYLCQRHRRSKPVRSRSSLQTVAGCGLRARSIPRRCRRCSRHWPRPGGVEARKQSSPTSAMR
jgi:hypothetical protein